MLILVATPIGNLSDMSPRAVEALRDADLIASEDTRHTGRLLKHFEIETRQMAFHEHNEQKAADKIIRALDSGQTIAIVSDAGMPGISDPGFSIVRRAVAEGFDVSAIPGATAFAMAVVISGLPTNAFTFRGFPPRKSGKRKNFLKVDLASPHTLVLYESPYRLLGLLEDALEVFGDRQAAVCNELTKLYENVQRGTLSELVEVYKSADIRGEFAVVIAGAGK